MLSRVACNVYWLTRYLERAENTARLINVHGNLLLDLPGKKVLAGWEPLIAITGNETLFYEYYRSANETNVIKFLLADERNPSAILSALKQTRENLRTTRDLIPRETFEELNDFYLYAQDRIKQGISRRNRYIFMQQVIRASQHITGILHGTMSHDVAYNFMRIGCYLERADMTSRILDARSANLLAQLDDAELTPFENIQWMSVLKSLSAYQMYRQHVRLRVQGADVLKFLLQDNEFPRAYFYCLERIGYCLKGLPKHQAPLRQLRSVQRQIKGADVYVLAHDKQDLHQFIDQLQLGLAKLHSSIQSTYFEMNPAKHTLPSAA